MYTMAAALYILYSRQQDATHTEREMAPPADTSSKKNFFSFFEKQNYFGRVRLRWWLAVGRVRERWNHQHHHHRPKPNTHTHKQTQQRKPINHHFYTRRTPGTPVFSLFCGPRGKEEKQVNFVLSICFVWESIDCFSQICTFCFFTMKTRKRLLRWTTISMTQAFASMSFRVFPPLCGFSPSFKPSRTIWRVTSSAVDQTSSRYYCHFRSCSCCPPFCLTVVCVTDDSGDLTSCCWIISLSLSLLLSIALIVVWSFAWRSEFERRFFFLFFCVPLFVFRRLFSPLPPFYMYNFFLPFRLCVNELALNKKTTPPSTIVYIFYIVREFFDLISSLFSFFLINLYHMSQQDIILLLPRIRPKRENAQGKQKVLKCRKEELYLVVFFFLVASPFWIRKIFSHFFFFQRCFLWIDSWW